MKRNVGNGAGVNRKLIMIRLIRNTICLLKAYCSRMKSALRDHSNNKYISYGEAIVNLCKNKNLKYETYTFKSVKKFKTSDTIFILGSGPSLNRISSNQVNHIKEHDSMGINKSFLRKDLVPTFHQSECGKGRYEMFRNIWEGGRGGYGGVGGKENGCTGGYLSLMPILGEMLIVGIWTATLHQ